MRRWITAGPSLCRAAGRGRRVAARGRRGSRRGRRRLRGSRGGRSRAPSPAACALRCGLGRRSSRGGRARTRRRRVRRRAPTRQPASGVADRRPVFPAAEPIPRSGRTDPACVPSDPHRTFHEHMFPSLTPTRRPTRSLSERLRDVVGTALEFATLGEATLGPPAPAAPASRPAAEAPGMTAPTAAHPHRRRARCQVRRRRPGTVAPRPQVCRTPVHRPAPPRQP